MTYSKIATYPLAQYVPPIHDKGLTPYEVAQLTHHAQGRFIMACNEALDPLGLRMDTSGTVWGEGVASDVRDIVEETADSLDYEDIFEIATEWRARNASQ